MVEWFSYHFGAKDVESAILVNTHLDSPFGPEKFTAHICNFVEILKEMDIDPWVISEASDTQEIGAQHMRDLYNN